MAELNLSLVELGLEKFRFKRFAPVSTRKELEAMTAVWLESLCRNHVSQEEFMAAVIWLADNKPEWPDVADVITEVKELRKARDEAVPKIGIPVEGNVLRLVYADSPEAARYRNQLANERQLAIGDLTRPNFLEAERRAMMNDREPTPLSEQIEAVRGNG